MSTINQGEYARENKSYKVSRIATALTRHQYSSVTNTNITSFSLISVESLAN